MKNIYAKSIDEVVEALEERLKPEYRSDAFTWHRIEGEVRHVMGMFTYCSNCGTPHLGLEGLICRVCDPYYKNEE